MFLKLSWFKLSLHWSNSWLCKWCKIWLMKWRLVIKIADLWMPKHIEYQFNQKRHKIIFEQDERGCWLFIRALQFLPFWLGERRPRLSWFLFWVHLRRPLLNSTSNFVDTKFVRRDWVFQWIRKEPD